LTGSKTCYLCAGHPLRQIAQARVVTHQQHMRCFTGQFIQYFAQAARASHIQPRLREHRELTGRMGVAYGHGGLRGAHRAAVQQQRACGLQCSQGRRSCCCLSLAHGIERTVKVGIPSCRPLGSAVTQQAQPHQYIPVCRRAASDIMA